MTTLKNGTIEIKIQSRPYLRKKAGHFLWLETKKRRFTANPFKVVLRVLLILCLAFISPYIPLLLFLLFFISIFLNTIVRESFRAKKGENSKFGFSTT